VVSSRSSSCASSSDTLCPPSRKLEPMRTFGSGASTVGSSSEVLRPSNWPNTEQPNSQPPGLTQTNWPSRRPGVVHTDAPFTLGKETPSDAECVRTSRQLVAGAISSVVCAAGASAGAVLHR
jgi:hypothetical protein